MTIAPVSAQDLNLDEDLVGIRLLDAPESRRDDPRAQSAIVDHLPILADIERRVEVTNTTSETLEIDVYAAAASADGGGWVTEAGRAENDLTAMITMDPPVLRVPPGGGATSTMRLQVSADAPQREHYAVIWAELPPAPGQVSVVSRVGVRMYISIGNGQEPASDFVVDSLAAGRTAEGAPVVRARVSNTGGRALDLQGELVLTDGPGGLSAGPFRTPSMSTLGIDERAPIGVELDASLPAGPWRAVMTVTSGRIERIVEADITFPEAADGTERFADPVEARPVRPGGAIGPSVAGLFLLGTAGVLLFVWRRRRREEDEIEEAVAVPPGPVPDRPTDVPAPGRTSDD